MPQPAVPREDPTEELVFIGFKVVESMADAIDELAARRTGNRSQVIREAIDAYIAAQEVPVSA